MPNSIVVTGGGRGVGRSIVERLLTDPGCHVVIVELEDATTAWTADHPENGRIEVVVGDASDPSVAGRAADAAEVSGRLTGWVNNAAIFGDANLHEGGPGQVLELIDANLVHVITGSAEAVKRFLRAGTRGSIVNVSSHQATRPVRGALPYATAKAAVEGYLPGLPPWTMGLTGSGSMRSLWAQSRPNDSMGCSTPSPTGVKRWQKNSPGSTRWDAPDSRPR